MKHLIPGFDNVSSGEESFVIGSVNHTFYNVDIKGHKKRL